MKLDGIMFDGLLFSLFTIMVGFVMEKSSARPHIFDDVVMHEVFNGGVFKFIGRGCKNNCMMLCELHKDLI